MIDLFVVSGFLGAGKTTFANQLLSYYARLGEHTVYIVNEFGATDIDASLMRFEGFEAVTLSNGCICCSLKNELVVSLREVVRKLSPRKIVFETSGIFVFDSFEDILRDEYLRTRCRIRSRITIVDSLCYQNTQLLAGSFAENQIKNASLLILSKLERFSGDITEILCDLRRINAGAAIMACPWDEPDFIEQAADAADSSVNLPSTKGHAHAHVKTGTLSPADMSRDAYAQLVSRIVSGEYGTFLRVKGYIDIEGQPHLLNIAQSDVVLKPQKYRQPPLLVCIGTGFDPRSLGGLIDA